MYTRFGKRAMDVILSGLVLLISLPVMLITTLVIYLDDRGPILFRQTRIGANGKTFEIKKFRSMTVGTENRPSAIAGALRVTRVGRVIRRLNIDELPQLLNILKGDMSIVGPRPALPTQSLLLALREQNGSAQCKPGVTGLAQVSAYTGMPEAEKADWDGRYAGNVTFWNDVKILFRTTGYVLRKPPVY